MSPQKKVWLKKKKSNYHAQALENQKKKKRGNIISREKKKKEKEKRKATFLPMCIPTQFSPHFGEKTFQPNFFFPSSLKSTKPNKPYVFPFSSNLIQNS